MPTQTAEQYYSLNAGGGQGGKNTNTKKKEMGSYEKALAKDKKLPSYIKERNNAKKSGDKSAYNAAQNKINKAYGKGPTNRPVSPKKADTPKKNSVMKDQANETKAEKIVKTGAGPNAKPSEAPKTKKPSSRTNDPNGKVGKLTSSDTKKKLDSGTFKEDKEATSSQRQEVLKERIKAGDKKAGKKAGLKGGLKRKGNRAGKRQNKLVTGGKKSERIAKKMDKVDVSTEKGFAKADKLNKKASMVDTKNKRKKSKQKLKDIILTAPESPSTFKDFDQMDSKNAKKTAGEKDPKKDGQRSKDRKTQLDKYIEKESSMENSPINYFKQAIKYNVKEASNPSLSSSARKHYAENAQHDMKSMGKMDNTMAYKHGAMKGDQSASRIDYANYKGTDKGYHGKTGASHGDQSASRADYMGKSKKGSILSKHMKSN